MTGLLHLYTGDGKGKTTAAVGLAIRCAGTGDSVLFTQFLKAGTSAELTVLEQIPQIVFMGCEQSFGFTFRMTEEEKKKAAAFYEMHMQKVIQEAQKGSYRLLVLDEIVGAVAKGMVPKEQVLSFLKERPKNLEVVLTGRDPAREFLELADYVTEMKKIRHPYEKGISARRGIEW